MPVDENASTPSFHVPLASTRQVPTFVANDPILASLWDSPDLGVVLVTLQDEINAVNPVFCTQTGQLAEALMGQAYASVLKLSQAYNPQVVQASASDDLNALDDTLVDTPALFEDDDLNGQDLHVDDETVTDNHHLNNKQRTHTPVVLNQHQHLEGQLRHQNGKLHEVYVTVMPLSGRDAQKQADVRILLVRTVAQDTASAQPQTKFNPNSEAKLSTASTSPSELSSDLVHSTTLHNTTLHNTTLPPVTSNASALDGTQLNHLLQLVETISDFICLMDSEGVVRYVNPAGLELVGEGGASANLNASVFVTVNAKNSLISHFATAIQTGKWVGETHFSHADGRSFPVSQVLMPLYDEAGELTGFGTIARDISAQKQLEDNLRASQTKMRALLEAIPDLMFVFDKDGRYLDVAGRTDDMTFSPEDLVGFTLEDVLPAGLAKRLFDAIQVTLASGEPQCIEYHIATDPRVMVSEAQLVKMTDDQVLMVSRDITSQKRTERNLHIFQSLVEAATDGITIVDDSGKLRYSNPAYKTMLGLPTDAPVNQPQHASGTLTSAGRATLDDAINAMSQTGRWQGTLEHQHTNGQTVVTDVRSFAIYDSRGDFIQAGSIVRDVSQEHDMKKQLEQQRRLLNDLLEHLPMAVCVIDVATERYLLANQAHADITTFTSHELIGQTQVELFGDTRASQWRAVNQQVIEMREPITFEEYVVLEDAPPRHYLTTKFPMTNAQDDIYAVGVVGHDVSTIKQTETSLRERTEQLNLLNTMSRNLNTATDYAAILEGTVSMLNHLGLFAANLFIIDNDAQDTPTHSTKVAAWHHYGGVHGEAVGSRLKIADYPTMAATFEDSQTTHIKHLHQLHKDVKFRWQRAGIGTLVIVPIAPASAWLGKLILYWREERTFTDNDIEILNALPDILAPVVANRHLLNSLEQTVHERSQELQQSQALLQGFLDNVPALMYVKDTKLRFMMANDGIAQVFGTTNQGLVGTSDFDFFNHDVATQFSQVEQNVLDTGESLLLEEDTPGVDGLRHFITTKFPITDQQGTIQALGGFSFDITERKRAEQALQTSREQLAKASAELNITKRIQELLLPSDNELEVVSDLAIAGVMRPADHVGGDYYDVLVHDQGVMLGIGDVTDHGLESGLLMLMTQTAVRTLLEADIHDTATFFDILNRVLYDNLARMRADKSLTLLRLDYDATSTNNMRLSGQHEQVLVVRTNGEIEPVDTLDLGIPLGLERSVAHFIAETQLHLAPGDGVVLYTDGITEAENDQLEQYGLDRLCATVSRHWRATPHDICQFVLHHLDNFIDGHTVHDDITLVVAKRRSESS
ncbi:MAG: PAS domain-containing protein [Deinococcota bacterium]